MPLVAANPTAFATAMGQSHRIATRIEVIPITGVSIDINATTYPGAVVVSAEVTVDRQAKIRRRCTLRIQDHAGTLVPTTTGSYLTPFGNSLRLYRGVTYDDGTTDLLLLGTFRIAEVEIEDTGDSSEIIVTGYDASRAVSRAKFEAPYPIASATNFGTATRTLITARYPAAAFLTDSWTLDGTYPTTPPLLFPEGNDPWDRALDLANSVGQELWVDEQNRFRLNPQPSPLVTDTPNFTWTAGSTSTFSMARRRLTDENTYNKAIISGESTSSNSDPVRGTAEDTDTSSPTFYGGGFGKVPIFQQRGEITTVVAATTAATALLRLTLGLHEPVTIQAIPDPRVIPGDLVALTIPRVGITDVKFIVDSVRMPLGATEKMEVTLQARRLI